MASKPEYELRLTFAEIKTLCEWCGCLNWKTKSDMDLLKKLRKRVQEIEHATQIERENKR